VNASSSGRQTKRIAGNVTCSTAIDADTT
jgi:hypothetical protein